MAKKPKYVAKAGEAWTRTELSAMKKMGGRTPTRVIGLKLQRPVGGVRKKARAVGMTLKPTNRSPWSKLGK